MVEIDDVTWNIGNGDEYILSSSRLKVVQSKVVVAVEVGSRNRVLNVDDSPLNLRTSSYYLIGLYLYVQ